LAHIPYSESLFKTLRYLADEQSGFYREIRIFLRPATSTGLGRMPCGERLLGEPDRDITTLA